MTSKMSEIISLYKGSIEESSRSKALTQRGPPQKLDGPNS